jgi:transcriptional regulator with XRE-family HTH domain
MEERGLRQTDIAEIVGGKNRASEVLSRKRPLTLAMIRALHEKLGIPSELLIQEPRAEYRVERKPRKTWKNRGQSPISKTLRTRGNRAG